LLLRVSNLDRPFVQSVVRQHIELRQLMRMTSEVWMDGVTFAAASSVHRPYVIIMEAHQLHNSLTVMAFLEDMLFEIKFISKRV
jgi:hypothetical protein